MRRRFLPAVAFALAAATAWAGLSPDIDQALKDAKFVYIQSERKSGDFGKAAEIWFFFENGSVYVGTRPTSWRVKRIKAGHTKARIAVGKVDGPTFDATGSLSTDGTIQQHLLDAYAKKYPERWEDFESGFRDGFKSGERVLVKYTPR
jgi:hypothetical protein